MARRIILGANGANTGMWVSKPGKDAASTVFEDLLIDTTRINTQPVMKGTIVNPSLSRYRADDYPLENRYLWDQLYKKYYWVACINGNANDYYRYTITHNLGYIPLCHISIESANAGEPYPQVYLSSTQLMLEFVYTREGETNWNGSFWQTLKIDAPGDPWNFGCNISYTLFRQRAV